MVAGLCGEISVTVPTGTIRCHLMVCDCEQAAAAGGRDCDCRLVTVVEGQMQRRGQHREQLGNISEMCPVLLCNGTVQLVQCWQLHR